MIVSIDWLKEYIEIDMPLDELAEKLTLAGIECVLKEAGKHIPEGVIVGRVLEKKPHPNADKLSVCKVDIGSAEKLSIVCGAPNVESGQLVPVATEGTRLAPDFALKKVKIRGVESQGTICAEDELGLGDDHSGIIVLPGDYELGRPYNDYFSSMMVLDIDVTANRPDIMSHWGVARMVSAITGKTFKKADADPQETGPGIHDIAEVHIAAPEACPRYTARIVKNVRIAPSPDWMQKRLEAVGLRPVNNIVDAANYVLMETGHPLHTFDLDKLEGNTIKVRFAEENEKFETLDHKERELSKDILLICDAERPVALAGIMGGTESEVDENTTDVLIESAYFTPGVIRTGAKQQQIATDASKRFERGTDPNDTLVYAQDRLASLIGELADGETAKGMIDVYPEPIKPKTATLRLDFVKRITGIEISMEECKNTLSRLGFIISGEDDHSLRVQIPTFRPDVEREIDLVEEVAMNYIDRIPSVSRMSISVPEAYDKFHPFITELRNFFIGHGFHEAVNNSLQNEKEAEKGIWEYTPLKILNPLSREMDVLRTDMIQPLIGSLKSNAAKKRSSIRLFELANVIKKNDDLETHAEEHYNLGVICSSPLWRLTWAEEDKAAGLFYMKGVLDQFLDERGFTCKLNENKDRDEFEVLYDIIVRKSVVGKIGQYRKDHFEKLQLRYPVVIMELQIGKLFKWYDPRRDYTPPSPFPSIFRDISLVMDKDVKAAAVLNDINQHGGKYLVDCVLYDVYIDNKKLGDDKKALSFRLEFQSDKQTLKDETVDNVMEKLFKQIKNQYGAQLR
ncbi:MAG: phenylalanine--tRNA ligase subunit beta [Fidelibacterota bacterium]